MNDKYKLTPLNSNTSLVLDFEKCGAEFAENVTLSDNTMSKRIYISEYNLDAEPEVSEYAFPDNMANVAPLLKIMETGVVSAHFKFPPRHSTILSNNGVVATVPLFADDYGNGLIQLHGVLNFDDNKYIRVQLLAGYSWNSTTHIYKTYMTFRVQIRQRT